MGCTTSQSTPSMASSRDASAAFANVASYREASAALANGGLERTQLVLGFDFSAVSSDENVRAKSAKSLRMFCGVLEGFQRDSTILAYGFGDLHTQNQTVFSFQPKNGPCKDSNECWRRFTEIREKIVPWGSTCIAPMVREPTNLVRKTQEHHTLVIVLETELDKCELEHVKCALEESSRWPLAIVIVSVGLVGQNSWYALETLPMGNVNFVHLDDAEGCWQAPKKCERRFLMDALKKVPRHYSRAKQHGQLVKSIESRIAYQTSVCNPPDRPEEGDAWYGLQDDWDAYWDVDSEALVYFNRTTKETSCSRPQPTCKDKKFWLWSEAASATSRNIEIDMSPCSTRTPSPRSPDSSRSQSSGMPGTRPAHSS